MAESYKHPIPSELVKHVTAICGDRGAAWLRGLPQTIGELEEIWDVKIGMPFIKGEFNFVAEASWEDGVDAVAKISPPYERIEIFSEAEYLSTRQGNGCVTVIAQDASRHALLIERARPGVSMDVHFESDPFACVEPAIEVLSKITLPATANLRHFQQLDDWFARFQRFRGTEFPQDYGEKALAIYERLRSDSVNTFHLHGDFHPGNIVSSDRGPFIAIDPKGLIGHLCYDVAVFLNNLHWWQKGVDGVERELTSALRKFAAAFSLNERYIREAAYAFMVIGAWWTFDDMREHYDNEVALADIWGI